MKKIKKFTLKKTQKNILIISSIITASIGIIKEVLSFFKPLVARASESISPPAIQPVSETVRVIKPILSSWITKIDQAILVNPGQSNIIESIKHWAFSHWNLVLTIVGILVILLIIFLVDEIKDHNK